LPSRVQYGETVDWDEDTLAEWRSLYKLDQEGRDATSEWLDGEALIRDSYFEDYARELAQDIGAIGKGEVWPLTCIDWEHAARELQHDYTTVDFDGVEYWVRSC